MKLKIIHTNDIHSNFENFSRAVTLIKQHADENTIILEAGDFADFKSIELQGTRGGAAVELLEYAGYDALTIGNNEMFNSVETLEYMAESSPMPFISNNLSKADRTPVSGVVSSAILEKNGLRILVTGSSPDMGEFNEGLNIHIKDYKQALAEELKRNAGNYDLCIVLNHIGTAADEELTKEMEGIDIIISAHDHQLYEEAKVVNGTIMNSAGCYGQHIGILEVEFTDNSLHLIKSLNLPTENSTEDDGVRSILKRNKEKAIESLSAPLYSINHGLWHDVIEENPLTNLIADGLHDLLDCDLSLINSGIVNAGLFGYVSEKKLIEISPSPLNPTTFEIQGKDLKQALEDSLDPQVCLADGRGPGFRGKYAGRLHVSGATVKHDGKQITELLIGGQPLEDERWYTVGTSDYLHRGSGYRTLANNRNEKYRPEYIRDVIRTYARNEDFIKGAFANRWKEAEKVKA